MPAVTDTPTEQPTEVTARPVKAARIATIVAIVVGAAFIACAVALPHTSDGVRFTLADQFGIGGTGVLIALAIMSITRPRMRANAVGIDTRGFFGGYRHVDWDLVSRAEFPPKARFARLVLPGEELIVLYAVQRGDAEQSVAVMHGLRHLHSAHRPDFSPGPSPGSSG